MCGICGAFRIDGGAEPPLSAEVLRSMTDADRLPRPGRRGLRAPRRSCSLGARRLSIIDVDGGHQPFVDESRPTCGRRRTARSTTTSELREQLAARRSHAAQPLRHGGPAAPLRGARAGPRRAPARHVRRGRLGRRDARRGVLIRDRLGVKPLYYAIVDGVVVFGSELKCVIASGLVDDTLDPEAIAAYLTLGFVPAPLTPLKQVRKLQPGERLVVDDGMARTRALVERTPRRPPTARSRSAEEWAEIVLAQARRVRADAADERRAARARCSAAASTRA